MSVSKEAPTPPRMGAELFFVFYNIPRGTILYLLEEVAQKEPSFGGPTSQRAIRKI